VPYTAPRLRPMLRPLLVAVAFFLALSFTSTAFAEEENPNTMACGGHLTKGTQDPADPDTGVVEYTVGCNGKISGYSLVSTREIDGYETEIFGRDSALKEIVATDFFSCGGDTPGFGINCVGSTSWGWRLMTGTFTIVGDVCAEPRVSVQMIATSIVSGKQAITGPFNIGRPRGCPKAKPAKKPTAVKKTTKKAAASKAAAKQKARRA